MTKREFLAIASLTLKRKARVKRWESIDEFWPEGGSVHILAACACAAPEILTRKKTMDACCDFEMDSEWISTLRTRGLAIGSKTRVEALRMSAIHKNDWALGFVSAGVASGPCLAEDLGWLS